MAFGGPSEGELRLAMAEMIRRDPILPIEEQRDVRAVVSWWGEVVPRYPGTSSYWEEFYVKVLYSLWSDPDEQKIYLIEGTYEQLLPKLAQLVEDVGNER